MPLSDGDENGAWYGTWGPSGTNYFGFTRDVQPGAGGLVQPSLGINQPIASGDPDFAQFDLSSNPTAEEAYKRAVPGLCTARGTPERMSFGFALFQLAFPPTFFHTVTMIGFLQLQLATTRYSIEKNRSPKIDRPLCPQI